MPAEIYREKIVGFAATLGGKIVRRLKHRPELANMEVEDIEQEILMHVLEHAHRYDSAKGNVAAFATRLVQNAVAKLIRKSNRVRVKPPEGMELESISKKVEGPYRKSEELSKGLASSDNDRRRQTVRRDPLKDFEITDAIEFQIASLPDTVSRNIAHLLRTCSKAEIARRLGLSKRRVNEAVELIREHFSTGELDEIIFSRAAPSTNCIDSTGGSQTPDPTGTSPEENKR